MATTSDNPYFWCGYLAATLKAAIKDLKTPALAKEHMRSALDKYQRSPVAHDHHPWKGAK